MRRRWPLPCPYHARAGAEAEEPELPLTSFARKRESSAAAENGNPINESELDARMAGMTSKATGRKGPVLADEALAEPTGDSRESQNFCWRS